MTFDSQPGSVRPSRADFPRRRIVVLDSQRIFREALRVVVDRDATFEIVGDAGTAIEALALIDSLQPEMILTEFALPDRSGMQFITEVHSRWPHVGILVLTTRASTDWSAAALGGGALGCLPKTCGGAEFLRAIGQVARGQKYVCPSIQLRRARNAESADPSNAAPARLTGRQSQILRAVALGYNNREIAQMLGIGAKAVSKHRTRLRDALRLPTTAGLTRYAVREGLVPENYTGPFGEPPVPAAF